MADMIFTELAAKLSSFLKIINGLALELHISPRAKIRSKTLKMGKLFISFNPE